MSRPAVQASSDAPPFDRAWLQTVFLVPEPPRAWPGTFAVVTACNPAGRIQTDDENRRATGEFRAFLDDGGMRGFEVIGASPDLRHREPGRAVACSLEVAAALAERFGQAGFFWVEGGEVFACVDASGRGWSLGAWEGRVVSTRP